MHSSNYFFFHLFSSTLRRPRKVTTVALWPSTPDPHYGKLGVQPSLPNTSGQLLSGSHSPGPAWLLLGPTPTAFSKGGAFLDPSGSDSSVTRKHTGTGPFCRRHLSSALGYKLSAVVSCSRLWGGAGTRRTSTSENLLAATVPRTHPLLSQHD